MENWRTEEQECTCCGKFIKAGRSTWLEGENSTARYLKEGTVASNDSQGLYPFGAGCARKVRKNGGDII